MSILSPITPIEAPHLLAPAFQPGPGILWVFRVGRVPIRAPTVAAVPAGRVLIRPEPGFYVMRLRSGAPLVAAVIYQLCPMVIPQPTTIAGPHPDEWCRPLDRPPRYEARVDGKRVDLDRVWTARSLRPIRRTEFEFRSGPLRRWARANPGAPEARPHSPVDLSAIPPLF